MSFWLTVNSAQVYNNAQLSKQFRMCPLAIISNLSIPIIRDLIQNRRPSMPQLTKLFVPFHIKAQERLNFLHFSIQRAWSPRLARKWARLPRMARAMANSLSLTPNKPHHPSLIAVIIALVLIRVNEVIVHWLFPSAFLNRFMTRTAICITWLLRNRLWIKQHCPSWERAQSDGVNLPVNLFISWTA